MRTQSDGYDIIVVGGGSAGAVVATRLAEDPKTRVLLLEAGPENSSYWSRVPLGFAKLLFKPEFMWLDWQTQPDADFDDKVYALPHGRVLGGSSAINGLVHLRGNPSDYNEWEAMGATGWNYDSLLPYFKKSETSDRGETQYRGGSGPVKVEKARWQNPLADALVDASVKELGIPKNPDFNQARIEGAGYFDLIASNGKRSSTDQVYLKDARKRPNLDIITEAPVTKLIFDGKRAIGVRYRKGGEQLEVRTRGDVILSAGALHTPQLLQVSGVGPGKLLQSHGISVVHDLPGVGENLTDHITYGSLYTTDSKYTFNKQVRSPLQQMIAGMKHYLLPRKGPLNIGACLAGAYFRTDPALDDPDVVMQYLPFFPDETGFGLAKESGFRVALAQGRPRSRGYARITGASIDDQPDFVFNHLSEQEDVEVAVRGLRMMFKAVEGMPAELGIKRIDPGPNPTDDEIIAYVKESFGTGYHFAGTAKMGTDAMAVVDPQTMRVHGIDGLRVVDASLLPGQVTANINAAVLATAERAADLIKKSR